MRIYGGAWGDLGGAPSRSGGHPEDIGGPLGRPGGDLPGCGQASGYPQVRWEAAHSDLPARTL